MRTKAHIFKPNHDKYHLKTTINILILSYKINKQGRLISFKNNHNIIFVTPQKH